MPDQRGNPAYPSTPPLPGKPVRLSVFEFVVPALSLSRIVELQPELSAIRCLGRLSWVEVPPEVTQAAIKIAHVGLRRNYPELREDIVAEILDVSNIAEVLEALLAPQGYADKETVRDEADEAEASADYPQPGDRLMYCWPPFAG